MNLTTLTCLWRDPIDVQSRVPLIRKKIEPHLTIHDGHVHGVLGDQIAPIGDHRQRHFVQRDHRLHINNREPADRRVVDPRDPAAHHHGLERVRLAVAEELAVLVVRVVAGVLDHGPRGGEGRRRGELVVQVPERRHAAAPVERQHVARAEVVDRAALVVGNVRERLRLEGGRVDADERRRRVGPVLRQRGPDVGAVVVDAAVVVLGVARARERRVGDAPAGPGEDDHVAEAGAGGAVGAVDHGAVVVLLRRLRVLAGGDEVAVVADAHEALGLEGVALEGHALDQCPLGRARQLRELPDDLLALRRGAGRRQRRGGDGGVGLIDGHVHVQGQGRQGGAGTEQRQACEEHHRGQGRG